MTPEEAVAKLDAITADNEEYAGLRPGQMDIEGAHVDADNVLWDFVKSVAPEVSQAYERLRDRADDWWFA